VLTAFGLWKVIKKTEIIRLADIPLMEAFERAAEDQEVVKHVPKWWKVAGFLGVETSMKYLFVTDPLLKYASF
jgi:hypothetical protein